MHSCGLTCVDIPFFAHFLRCNRDLEELQLAENDIGNQGLKALAGFLRNNTSLRTLILDDNQAISEAGIKDFTKTVKQNETINTVSLIGCSVVNINVFDELNELLRKNRAIYFAKQKARKEKLHRENSKATKMGKNKIKHLMQKSIKYNSRKNKAGSFKGIENNKENRLSNGRR